MRIDDDVRRRLCQARELLEKPDNVSSIAEIARGAGISRFHFIRLFDHAFGTTPHRCRVDSRLARAKVLLARGTSVTEACFETGFASLGSFSTLFARRVGETPSAYRRRVRIVGAVPIDLRGIGCFGLLALLPADPFRNFGEAAADRRA